VSKDQRFIRRETLRKRHLILGSFPVFLKDLGLDVHPAKMVYLAKTEPRPFSSMVPVII
jgi:hypothetical protein